MSDRKVIPFQLRSPSRPGPAGMLAEAAVLARGLLLSAALLAAGTVALAAALVAGVVGSPLLALAVAWLVLRHPRRGPARPARRLRVARG